MKKLGKNMRLVQESIQAYACKCTTCRCSCNGNTTANVYSNTNTKANVVDNTYYVSTYSK